MDRVLGSCRLCLHKGKTLPNQLGQKVRSSAQPCPPSWWWDPPLRRAWLRRGAYLYYWVYTVNGANGAPDRGLEEKKNAAVRSTPTPASGGGDPRLHKFAVLIPRYAPGRYYPPG